MPPRSLFTEAIAKGEGTTRAGRPCGHHMRREFGTLLAEGAWQEAQIDHLATMLLGHLTMAEWPWLLDGGRAGSRTGYGAREDRYRVAGVWHLAVIYATT